MAVSAVAAHAFPLSIPALGIFIAEQVKQIGQVLDTNLTKIDVTLLNEKSVALKHKNGWHTVHGGLGIKFAK